MTVVPACYRLGLFAAIICIGLGSQAKAQICGGSFSVSNSGGSSSSCPTTTLTASWIYSIVGNSQCPQAGVYTRKGTAKETVTINATGTCTPNCPYQGPPSVYIEHPSYTSVVWEWTNGINNNGNCAWSNQQVWRTYPEIGPCEGSFCCSGEDQCNNTPGATWVASTCTCQTSPLVIVMSGDFDGAFTSPENGAPFIMLPSGGPALWAWPAVGKDRVGWIVRDRDGNGQIDSGSELYGGATPQSTPAGQPRHGYTALKEEDTNGDGRITSDDVNFSHIAVWFDRNRDGITQNGEIVPLGRLGIVSLDTNYQTISQVDRFGNRFEFQSKAVQQRGRVMRELVVYDIYPKSVKLPPPSARR